MCGSRTSTFVPNCSQLGFLVAGSHGVYIFFPIVALVIISAKAEVTHFAKAASLAKLSLAGRALGFVLQGAKRLT